MAASATRRSAVADFLVTEFKTRLDGVQYSANIFTNCEKGVKFWDEVDDTPFLFVSPGKENRVYQPSAFAWGFLTLTLYIYVECEDDPQSELDSILHDVELVIDSNIQAEFLPGECLADLRILSIDTDEGVLAPKGVGEVLIQAQYPLVKQY